MNTSLNENFLNELLKLCLRKREVVEICVKHLKFHYLPIEAYKELWKEVYNYYMEYGDVPSIGIMNQIFKNEKQNEREEETRKHVLKILNQVRQTDIVDQKKIVRQLETYIKDAMSYEFFEKFAKIYDEGNRDGARKYMINFSDKMQNFSLTKTGAFESIFKGFKQRLQRKRLKALTGQDDKIRIPFFIDEVDERTGGGVPKTDIVCFLARSGVGKTKILRYWGVQTARAGFRVLHIQLEGSKDECEEGYDATWTAESLADLELGDLDKERIEELNNIAEQVLEDGGDIDVQAHETFDSATTRDIRQHVIDYEKKYGCLPDLVLIDYLELLEPSNGKRYHVSEERHRRIAVAEELKNIGVEFKIVVGTATQANDIPFADWNNPDFVMTRNNVSECKGLVKPFSFFFSLNQTQDEYEEGLMRLYADKLRKAKSFWTASIYTAYKYDKFYDRLKTMQRILQRKI